MRRALLIPALTLALGPTHAFGQDPTPAADAPCRARDPVTAEINAREGIRMAKAEQFEAAEALFVTATRLDPCIPKYPYLLGRAHDRQDEYDAAATAYRTVIEGFPTSVEFTKAQGALVKMQARRAAAEKAAEKAAAEAALKAEAERKRKAAAAAEREAEQARIAAQQADGGTGAETIVERPATVGDTPWTAIGWLTAGVGLAAVAAGVGFSLAAQDADDELTLAATRPDRGRYDELVDERETFTTLGWVGYGVGAALMLGGLTMVLVDEDPPLAIVPADGGALIGFSGRF